MNRLFPNFAVIDMVDLPEGSWKAVAGALRLVRLNVRPLFAHESNPPQALLRVELSPNEEDRNRQLETIRGVLYSAAPSMDFFAVRDECGAERLEYIRREGDL